MAAPAADPWLDLDPTLLVAAEAAQVSLWRFDVGHRVLALRGAVVARLGLPGKTARFEISDWRARVCMEDHSAMDAATRRLIDHGFAEVAYRVRAESGEKVWLELRGGAQIPGGAQPPETLTGFIYELGEDRKAERRGLVRERQLADGLEAGMVGIWTYDFMTEQQAAHGRILDWMGRPPEDTAVTSEDWRAVIHPDHQAVMRAAHERLREGRPIQPLEVQMLSPDGPRWVRTMGRVVSYTLDHEPLRAAGVILDIDAERRFAHALTEEQARFETIYRSMPTLLHSIDANGLTTMVSDYWLQRMGRRREDVIGAPGWAFMDEESAERVQRDVIPRAFERGLVEGVPVISFTAGGERLELRLSAFVERGGDGEPIAAHGVFSDVTDLTQAQRALESHAEALERSNRELNRFATVASHDLQEPLRKISAFASLLQHRHPEGLGEESDQALGFLIDAAGRMRALIDDLLAYSRASNRPLETETIELGPLVDAVLDELELRVVEAKAKIDLSSLPTVKGDAGLLRALFQNLISNALKYQKGDGVEISLSARPVEGGFFEICIADDGIGIDPQFSEKIFMPFARLHGREEYSGTGIGLAICQQAAERMGGRIWVESAPGEGARFCFTVPGA
jgi:PAS domain S-box-containing protein